MAEYITVLVFFLVILVFVLGTLFLARLLRAQKYESMKKDTYECGEEPAQAGLERFHVGYYLVALVFVIFDVEVIFLFPWAVHSKSLGLWAFLEIVLFIGILFLGWVYAYKKGNLEWK